MRRACFGLLLPTLTLMSSAAYAVDPVDSTALERAAGPWVVSGHLAALNQIGLDNGGTRASGTPGFTKSVNYVKAVLQKAGFTVKVQPFDYDKFIELSDAVFEKTKPNKAVFGDETFATMEYSAAGDVTAAVALAKGIETPPTGDPGTTNSGCAVTDFGPEVKGKIALIQRGTCTFADKVANAATAGAVAAIIFNEGQPGRTDVLNGTLGGRAKIPAIGTSYAFGKAVADRVKAGTVVEFHIKIDARVDTVTTSNVIGELRGTTRPGRVVVAGAHLDSVPEGPGINDNGSGTAQLLATAVGMRTLNIRPANTLRLAFWGAEESGLIGSTYYVDRLTDAQKKQIFVNLNFDMLGSPNYARLIYDGDGTIGDPGPKGSDVIEHVFEAWFKKHNLATEPTEFDGRSDYFAFIEAGIPAGGLFSGAEEIKTAAQVKLYGGTAGVAFDKCYHQACDRYGVVNFKAIRELGGAAVNAILTFATTGDVINTGGAGVNALAASASKAEWRGSHLVR